MALPTTQSLTSQLQNTLIEEVKELGSNPLGG